MWVFAYGTSSDNRASGRVNLINSIAVKAAKVISPQTGAVELQDSAMRGGYGFDRGPIAYIHLSNHRSAIGNPKSASCDG